MPPAITLERPTMAMLPSYVAALSTGYSPSSIGGRAAAVEQLARIEADPEDFLAGMDDPEALGGPVALPDGSLVDRLPGFVRWIWDGEFAGSIGLRWQRGTCELPPHVLGHIGYNVVPWRQRRGYATQALALMLAEARALGMPWLEITTDPANGASQKVIEANGGVLIERFRKIPAFGGGETLRYRVAP
jgi:predicted acetyltransferase